MSDPRAIVALRTRWWIILVFTLLGAVLGALPEPGEVTEQATSYDATHTLLANDAGDNAIVSPSQVTLLATAGEVPTRVADTIGYSGNSAELASQVDVQYDSDSGALTITATEATPEQAELVANTFADQLTTYLAERQDAVYSSRVSTARERLQELETELTDLTSQLALEPDDPVLLAQRDAVSRQYGQVFEENDSLAQSPSILIFTTLERAQAIPQVDRGLSAPSSRLARAAMGAAAGAAIGIAVAIMLGRVDRKIRTREQAEQLVAMRARVTIPRVRRTEGGVVVSAGRHDPLSDSYRTVRNVVGFLQNGLENQSQGRVTLIVSPGSGDGKTSLAANLAAAFLEVNQRVIAVNTDFRRPRLHEAIVGTHTSRLPYQLEDLDDAPPQAVLFETAAANMKVLDLSTMPGSPGQLARATVRQVERLADAADQIVIDSSPVGATAEVLDLVPLADVIVLVAGVGHTSVDATDRTIAILREIATAPIVFVLTGIKPQRSPYHEYSDRERPTPPPQAFPAPSEPFSQAPR